MTTKIYFQRVKTLYSYVCPDCDTWTRKLEAREKADGMITIRCPDCGFLEKFYGANA